MPSRTSSRKGPAMSRWAPALAHGNRAPRPRNAVAEETLERIVALARTRYAELNHTHLAEMIAEREGVVLSRPTVRSILLRAGLPSPRYQRPPRHRYRRQRKPQEGMLLQLGSTVAGPSWVGPG